MTAMTDYRIAGADEQDRRALDLVGSSGTLTREWGASAIAVAGLVIEDLDYPPPTSPAWTFCI